MFSAIWYSSPIDDGSFNGTKRSFDVFLPLGKYFGKRGDEFVLDISEYSFLVTNQNEDLHKYTRSVNASIKSSRGLDRIFGEPVGSVLSFV